MSVEEYLRQNMKAEFLQQTEVFKASEKYKTIRSLTSSKKFKTAQAQLLQRDMRVHKTILQDIQTLQNDVLQHG